MGIVGRTPKRDGFCMPARFAPHERTYMAWPHERAYTAWPADAIWRKEPKGIREEIAAIVRAVAQFEPVTLLVRPEDVENARASLGDIDNLDLFETPVDDIWVRDSFPLFVKNEAGEVALVNLPFNGWGGRSPCSADMAAGARLSERLGIRTYDAYMICEGGGISVDGEGTLITTESVMLNANRYLGRTQGDVEGFLREYLGAERVIWLKDGLAEDFFTDGHVDNVVEFIAPGVVLAQTASDRSNPNHEICAENLRRLREAKDAQGRELEIIEMDLLPYTREAEGPHAVVPYVNYYVVNGGIVAPMLGGPMDAEALPMLEALYSDREVVGVPSAAIAHEGGGVGCVTQQQPAGPLAT
jgi:agmatine deiminase